MQRKDFTSIKKHIKKASSIFIMGHKNIDLDAFGACVGVYHYASINNKKAFIIIDDSDFESSVKSSIKFYTDEINIIKGKNVFDLYDSNSILVILDTTKYSLFQNSDIVDLFDKILVIDHHNLGSDSIKGDNVYLFNDIHSSSTCEMLVNLFLLEKLQIPEKIATTLLSGIVLDTNNFIIKTSSDTYYAAYYLSKCGADVRKVQYILKEDINEYIEMQKVITDVKVVNKIAISKGLSRKTYRREDLAKVADIILLFKNIEASFVIGKTSTGIGISSRSMGTINVGKVLEKLGGGGDNHEAATVINDKNLDEVFDLVVSLSKKI